MRQNEPSLQMQILLSCQKGSTFNQNDQFDLFEEIVYEVYVTLISFREFLGEEF